MKMWIKSLHTNDGYLRHAPVSFREGLTCIIGARGTCKSTIVETIRFVCERKPRMQNSGNSAESPNIKEVVKETLGSGTAACLLETRDANSSVTEVRIEKTVNTEEPLIYRAGVLEPLSSFEGQIEAYSQGDLHEISDQPALRLRFVDRPHKGQLARIKRQLSETRATIARLGGEIIAERAKIRDDSRHLQQIPELEAQLKSVQASRPAVDKRLEEERTSVEHRERILRTVLGQISAFDTTFSQRLSATPLEQEVVAVRASLEALGIPESTTVAHDLAELAQAAMQMEAHRVAAYEHVNKIKNEVQKLETAFETKNQQYRALRRDQESIAASLEQEDQIRAQLRRLEQLRDKISARQATLQKNLEQRQVLRLQVDAALDERYRLRLSEIEKINADLTNIAVSLVQGAQSTAFVDQLSELLQKTRLRNQREIAKRIADFLSPAELIQIIEQEDSDRLAKVGELDPSQANRIITHFHDNITKVLQLETIEFDDHLDIRMSIRGESKPIEQLSRGQMATALLPLILRDAAYPLIFDQPEDDLDNSFIFQELVAKIRKLKKTRQIIFVTHNANIPVLGEADQVIAMQMASAQQAAPPRSGTVDEMREPILEILEGGAEAFRKRGEKYGPAV